jgi:hypothetical protein
MRRLYNLILVLAFVLTAFLPTQAQEKEIHLYFFHAQGCLTCAAEEAFLKTLLEADDSLILHSYEIAFDQENQAFVKEVSELLPTKITSTPSLVIGQEVIVGFIEGATDEAIKDQITFAKNNVIKDVIGEVLGIVDVTDAQVTKNTMVNVPFFGKVEAKSISLPIFAILLGGIDGFNPCAMWVLILLISMLFHLEEAWKKWLLGAVFLLTTAVMYLFFMVSWLNITLIFGSITWIRLLIALIAFAGAAFNIHRYFTTQPGCEVMDDHKRKKISVRIRQILSEPMFALAIIGTMVLAISVNLVEMICSAGLPVLFTQVLSLNDLSSFEYGAYMVLYVGFFILDDVLIFVLAMKSSELSGMSSKYARTAHLVGGLIMVLLGILMILKPEWLMFNFS